MFHTNIFMLRTVCLWGGVDLSCLSLTYSVVMKHWIIAKDATIKPNPNSIFVSCSIFQWTMPLSQSDHLCINTHLFVVACIHEFRTLSGLKKCRAVFQWVFQIGRLEREWKFSISLLVNMVNEHCPDYKHIWIVGILSQVSRKCALF